jgi:GMP synthase (glutamine-hydrolysing)
MIHTVAAIRHVHFEDLGLLATMLRERGATITYYEAWRDDLGPAGEADLLVVLGAPISANDTEVFPFVEREIAVVRERLRAGTPTLGLCLGAQIMARAAGGAVNPGERPEIGWGPIELTDAGQKSVVRHLADVNVLHWHGEVCAPPAGTPSLATTPICSTQAFALGPNALGLQFHAEIATDRLESWLVGHVGQITDTPGISVAGLRADTARDGPRLEPAARAMFGEWLDQLRAW